MTGAQLIGNAKRNHPRVFATGRKANAKGHRLTTWAYAVQFRHNMIRQAAAMGMGRAAIAKAMGLDPATVGRVLKQETQR